MENRDAIRQYLLETDLDFRQWVTDHRKLNQESDVLAAQVIPTPLLEAALQRIKRRKLLIRDRIERRIAEVMSHVTS
ncbi:dihydroxy-acid dehydratase [bacterium]|nr:dihydroxy-acid dehydratase [candidate division CSSED10-310 bacterium]